MDWDLNAIVRSCSTSKPTTISDQNTQASVDKAFSYLEDYRFFGFSYLLYPENNGYMQELQNSSMPVLAHSTGNNIPDSDIGAICSPFQRPPLPSTAVNLNPIQNQRLQLHRQILGSHITLPIRTTQSPASRSRKKKSSQKKLVMQVAAENLCSDVWAWRKYGQKPIKGSPYPRNYYRCSSSKGCTARKQVERTNTDPNLFTVSYTGDHTHPRPVHRNSLAGSVRSKIPTNQNLGNNELEAAPASIDKENNGLSPTTPLSNSMEHDTGNNMDEVDPVEVNGEFFAGEGVDGDEVDLGGEDVLIPNIKALDEDLLKGLRQLGGGGGGDGGNSNSSVRNFGRSPDFDYNFSNLIGDSGGATGSSGF